ncbi:MAG: hypothetical protein KAY65_06910 [Planctomycetes bacterium]|nr:hypothetical protein [Planctomycetota bacterium]
MCRIASIVALIGVFVSGALALDGAGTAEDPWRIKSLADFNKFAADANYWGGYTRLETDVNLAGITYTTAVIAPYSENSDDEFEGIAFTGVFDGNDHKISGMTIDGVDAWNDYIGLFGCITGGQIMNLAVEGGFVSGDSYVGGLAGYNLKGTVSGCYCSTNVVGHRYVGGLVGVSHQGALWKCHSDGEVDGTEYYAGGLAGTMSGTVSECYSTCNVSGGSSAGGLVGHNGGVLWNSYFSGDLDGRASVGGLVGHNYRGTIGNCYSAGDVSGDDGGGGLVGLNYRGDVSNCFWDVETQTHGTTKSISRSDNGTASNIAGLSTLEMQTESTYTSGGWDFMGESANGTSEVWQMPVGGGYPSLNFFYGLVPLSLSGSGTADDPYLISDANEIGMVRWYPEDSCFRLTDNVDLAGIRWSGPLVPRFNGSFDGDGHSLLDAEISGGGPLGVFGYVGEAGDISDLGLERLTVSRIKNCAGGLVGENRGSISNCYSAGSIRGVDCVGGLIGANYGDLSGCYSTVDVSATDHSVGGLVGHNYGSITNCYAMGSVGGESSVGGLAGGSDYGGAITNCYATGSVTGSEYVGGLVGRNRSDSSIVSCNAAGSVTSSGYSAGGLVGDNRDGRIANCWATASVTGSWGVGGLVGINARGIISSCCASGPVNSSADRVGGLVGHNNEGGIANCYASGSVTGIGYVGGLVGDNDEGTIRNCYAGGLVSGSADYVGGLVGYNLGDINGAYFLDPNDGGGPDNGLGNSLTDSQMRQQESFVGWDFVGECKNGTSEVWQMPAEGGYPVLSRLSGYAPRVLAGAGVPDDPYLIGDANELGTMHHYGQAACYRMTADIDLAGIRWSVPPMLACSGIFDGNDHVIRNLDVNTPAADCVGLFGYLDSGAEIRNLSIENASVAGQSHVGSLVGENRGGSISNCDVTGSVSGYVFIGGLVGENRGGSISNCSMAGSVTGDEGTVGGLVGENRRGSISGCYASGPVSGNDNVGGLVGSDREGIITDCYTTGSVDGDDHVGGLIGYTEGGSISNCYSTDSVSGGDYIGGLVGYNASEISNCYATGIVTGRGRWVGGLVGRGGGVTHCYATGSVSGADNTGGLVGDNEGGIITSCYATGTVSGSDNVGGLVGRGGGVTNCYATGSVNGNDYVGGLMGRGGGVAHCYAIGSVSGNDYVGGLMGSSSERTIASFWDVETSGQASSRGGKGATTIQMKSMATYGNAGWGGETWVIEDGVDYPRLAWEGTFGASISDAWPVPLAGTGTESDPYQVSTAADFAVLSWHISVLDKHIELTADVDLEGVLLHPIGDLGPSFSGVFDGHGHAIRNADINMPGSYYVGLFSYLDKDSQIHRLVVDNVSVSGDKYVGGLAGRSYRAVLSDCNVTGRIIGIDSIGGLAGQADAGSISRCFFTGDVNGVTNVGGLVGIGGRWVYIPGRDMDEIPGPTISESFAQGTVTGVDDSIGGVVGSTVKGEMSGCRFSGEVFGDDYVGGLAGSTAYSISGCSFSGEVSGDDSIGGLMGSCRGSVSNCSAGGSVSGDRWIGGLIGSNSEDGVVSDCNFTGSITGNESVGGLMGDSGGDVSNCMAVVQVIGSQDYVGGLAGGNGGVLSRCSVVGQVSGRGYIGGLLGVNGGTVTECGASVDVNGIGACIGGLIGESYGAVHGSYSTGSVEGFRYVGGLLGYASGEEIVTDCYAAGDVDGQWTVGGLVGMASGKTLSNCYCVGDVNGVHDSGGLAGEARWATVSNSFWGTDVQSHGVVETIGENDDSTLINVMGLSTSDMMSDTVFLSAGWDFLGETVNGREDIWTMSPDGYPHLVWALTLPGSGTEENPYRIEDLHDFDQFAADPEYWDDHVRLECDIDLSHRYYPNAVIAAVSHHGAPSFSGVFDGNGHKVVGLTIDAVGTGRIYVALFGQTEGATIKSLGVEDVHISTDYHAGAIVGYNVGGTIAQCYSTGYIEGGAEVGGLTSNSTQRSWVPEKAVVTNCYSTATVSGTERVGGLLGHNSGTVFNCYSSGDVAGNEHVGGLIGRNGGDQAITNCFWDIETQCHGVAVGIGEDYGEAEDVEGLPTTEMQTLSTFTSAGWDFIAETDNGIDDIWAICQGTNYPRLA